jgi:hypothetical protein
MSENGNGHQVETGVDETEELADNAIATEGADDEDEGNIQSDGGAIGKLVKK